MVLVADVSAGPLTDGRAQILADQISHCNHLPTSQWWNRPALLGARRGVGSCLARSDPAGLIVPSVLCVQSELLAVCLPLLVCHRVDLGLGRLAIGGAAAPGR